MEQGNPNKIDAIVEEMVKNNSVFKLKSPIEQDKEKDSIARSINSALSVLNEVGKELVLQELSVDPDEKFKGFIDSVGNIDISGLTQMTAKIVKAKIEEAEREGIDLRQGQPVFKNDNKISVVEGVLTVAVVNEMINNFENLTPEERGFLRDNYEFLTSEQRDKYDKEMINKIDKTKLSEAQKIDLKNAFTDDFHKSISDIITVLQKRYGENYRDKIKDISQAEIGLIIDELKISDLLKDKLKEHPISVLLEIEKTRQKRADLYTELDKAKQDGNIEKEKDLKELICQLEGSDIYTSWETINKQLQKEKDETSFEDDILNDNMQEEAKKNSQTAPTKKSNEPKTEDRIKQEIEQLPIALAKSGFSQEEIKEALNKYIFVLKNMDEADLAEAKELDKEQLSLSMKMVFSKVEIDEQIGIILSKLNFNGKIINILGNEEQKKEFFEQFDKVINQEHIQNKYEPLTGELEQIFSQYFQDNAVDMNVSAIEAQKEQTTQKDSEMYSFINAQYLHQDSIEGLIPRNGANSKALQDDKKSIFYSQGKEGAIVMYFEFLRQYNNLKGARGDKSLQDFANYQNGSLELTEEEVQLLQDQLAQISKIRSTQTFDEFMGDKLYLKLHGIDTVADKEAADQWRASHPGTKMNYNYANSWTNYTIPPDRIDVVSLQSINGNDVKIHQSDLIKYFLSQTSIDKIESLGVNDTTLNLIKQYYTDHSEEIANLGENYSLVSQNIQEFEQSRQADVEEKADIEPETPEETEQSTAIAELDDSFIGKIRRVFANMKDMKNKDNSKGFFARLGASIKTVFGNKDAYYEEQAGTEEQNNVVTTIKTEKTLSFDQQLQQNVKQPIISQATNTSPNKGSHNQEKSDNEIEF